MIGDFVLARSPVQFAFASTVGRQLSVLAYHGIEDPARFREHMACLCREKQPVAVNDVVRAVQGELVLPKDAVLVTFDDGDRTVLEHAAPVLKANGIPAAVFVITSLIDTETPFWWDEVEALIRAGGRCDAFREGIAPAAAIRQLKLLPDQDRVKAITCLRQTAASEAPRRQQLRRGELRELEAAGIVVGNHTHSHPCLHHCKDQQVRAEMEVAQELLTDILGRRPNVFAYPNGDQDPRVRRAAEVAGFDAAFLFDHRKTMLPVQDPLRLSRLRVNSTTSMDRFKIILSGLHPAIHHAIGRN